MIKTLVVFIFIAGTVVAKKSEINQTESSPLESRAGAGGQFCSGLLLLDQVPDRINALFSDTDCDACGQVNPVQIAADNFRMNTDGFISELVFYVGYFPADMPLEIDEWTATFHTNSTNLPGFVVYSETDVESTRVATGATLFGVGEYRVVLTFETPVELNAGNYWLEIHNNSVDSTDTVFWVSGLSHVNSRFGTVFSSAFPAVTWSLEDTPHFALQLCDAISDTIYKNGFEAVIEP